MEMTEEQRQRHYEKLAHYINTVRGYAHLTGIRVTKVDRDYCEGELDITPDKCNIAACSSGNGTVTINYGFSFLRPTTGTKVRCVAEPEKVGRTVSVFRCSLYNDEDKLVASGQFTFFMTGPLNLDEHQNH